MLFSASGKVGHRAASQDRVCDGLLSTGRKLHLKGVEAYAVCPGFISRFRSNMAGQEDRGFPSVIVDWFLWSASLRRRLRGFGLSPPPHGGGYAGVGRVRLLTEAATQVWSFESVKSEVNV